MSGAAPRQMGSLPAEMTSFVDRRFEFAEAKRILAAGRLLTLTGAGGVGKSRLALRVAADLRRAFVDGVWLAELAGLRDVSLLPHTIADTLNIRDYSTRTATKILVEHLRDQQVLLVLDNCEHLLPGCATLIGTLLREAPGLRVLATSRATIGVPGERVFPVPPLRMPAQHESLPSDADTCCPSLTLFTERAAAAQADFAVTPENRPLVAELCQRLDGIPLAIELAAARLRVLTLEGILDRLDDRYRLLTTGSRMALPRHRTLRAAVEWSYTLCTPEERTLWSRASVFADSFEAPAAEAVCSGGGLTRSAVRRALAGLVDKSIMSPVGGGGTTRFRLLDTLRDFGLDKLRAAGGQALSRRRHRDYYLRLVEEAEARWFGPAQREIFARTRHEHPNLRVALEFCLSTPGEVDTGLRMAGALYFYWVCCGFVSEGRHWLDRALALGVEPTRARVIALRVNAECAIAQGDHAGVHRMAEECRATARRRNDESMHTQAAYAQGSFGLLNGDLPRTAMLMEEVLARGERTGELTTTVVMARAVLSVVALFGQDIPRSIAFARQVLRIAEEHQELWTRSYALYFLAMAEWSHGDLANATSHAREGLRLKRIFNDVLGQAMVIELLAWTAQSAGEPERAAVLLGASERCWSALGGLPLLGSQHWIVPHQQCEAKAREVLGGTAFRAAFSRGRDFDLDEAATYALGEQPRHARTVASPLTARERQVAELVAKGLSNKEIARLLRIVRRTAEGHVTRILRKLDLTSREEIAARVAALGEGGHT
ncbi:ATP-binding protein [Allokutzneria oryzae]|uniref:LuxR C-terminal-related transcriptional regulator n=1 Tax=Allokutzneria oryzae TaxID=1378989 RepID=A0ABV6A3C0_9PSEU